MPRIPLLSYTVSMKMPYRAGILPILLLALLIPLPAFAGWRPPAAYLGFDRNDYPGDANLPALRRSFAFTGYWLSNPPGERANSWHGKRDTLQRAGFGFLLLFNGRDYAQLQSWRPRPRGRRLARSRRKTLSASNIAVSNAPADAGAAKLGAADGTAAVRAALAEDFRPPSVIFLDQEQGGRMLAEQKQYVFAWAQAVGRAGFRPGIYCSGIEVAESDGGRISTARDLHDSAQGSQLVFWVANDACPPSPGCAFPRPSSAGNVPRPESSGVPFAEVWQFAQSPVRRQFAAGCLNSYNPDGNCYAPDAGPAGKLHLDVNSARSADPSHARR